MTKLYFHISVAGSSVTCFIASDEGTEKNDENLRQDRWFPGRM
jgi:hypothetical protein